MIAKEASYFICWTDIRKEKGKEEVGLETVHPSSSATFMTEKKIQPYNAQLSGFVIFGALGIIRSYSRYKASS